MAAALPINNFSMLPSEMLPQVLTFLSTEDFFSALKSCKAFREIITTNPLIWQERIAMLLASPCPRHITGNQHRDNLRIFTAVRDGAADGVSERETFHRGMLAIQALKVYKTIPRALIDSLDGFNAYCALPELDLRGKRDRRGEPRCVFGLSQRDLVNNRGVFCPVMRGVFDENVGDRREERLEQRRFIAFALDTKEAPVTRFVLSFFERRYSGSVQDQTENLGKMTTEDLPIQYKLRSNMVQPGDFVAVREIRAGTHPLMALATR